MLVAYSYKSCLAITLSFFISIENYGLLTHKLGNHYLKSNVNVVVPNSIDKSIKIPKQKSVYFKEIEFLFCKKKRKEKYKIQFR